MTLIKDITYNFLFAVVLTIYSVQVCPHVSGLGILITGVSFLFFVIPLFFLRRQLVKRTRVASSIFWINLTYFLAVGIFVGIYNFLFREFPMESALKIISGALVLGALNSAIYQLELPFQRSAKRVSFINRIALFSASILALLSVVWILLIVEDINIFRSVQNGSMIDLMTSIVYESLFVWLVIILYLSRIIVLYKRRISEGIRGQISALSEIRNDSLDVSLPRFSNDEFSIIGDEVNEMIKRLREGKKIKKGLDTIAGEKVSKEIVDRISNQDFSSEKKEVAILFSDIVGFTTLCEQSNPEEFVESLNFHFQRLVDAVKSEDGVVNKFIGDAILVYFEGANSSGRALAAANKMIENSDFKIGIGLHFGQVLAGLIGASNRLEYTIIGSAVNLTARLESETRSLNANLVMSREFVDQLDGEFKKELETKDLQLKGFESEVKVYFK